MGVVLQFSVTRGKNLPESAPAHAHLVLGGHVAQCLEQQICAAFSGSRTPCAALDLPLNLFVDQLTLL